MNSFPLHTLETAPAESKALLTTIATRFGFLPNVYAYLAEARSRSKRCSSSRRSSAGRA
jgi:hypothetical protein